MSHPYTTDTFFRDTRITLAPDFTDPRLDDLAEHFRGRKFKGGFIFTPHRGMVFDRLYRAGFVVRNHKLVHPKVPGRYWTAGHAMQTILLAEKIGA